MLLKFPYIQWVIFSLAFKICLCLSTFWLHYIWLWISFHLSCLEFGFLDVPMDAFLHIWLSFQPSFLWLFFCCFSSSLSLWYTHHVHFCVLNGIPHFPEAVYSFFSLFFKLPSFQWSIFSFWFFLLTSSLLRSPSMELFFLVILLFISRISRCFLFLFLL